MKYDFQCPECKDKVEIECKADDYEEVKAYLVCDKCNKQLERLYSLWSTGATGGYDATAGKASWQG